MFIADVTFNGNHCWEILVVLFLITFHGMDWLELHKGYATFSLCLFWVIMLINFIVIKMVSSRMPCLFHAMNIVKQLFWDLVVSDLGVSNEQLLSWCGSRLELSCLDWFRVWTILSFIYLVGFMFNLLTGRHGIVSSLIKHKVYINKSISISSKEGFITLVPIYS